MSPRESPRILHVLLDPSRGGAEEHALSLLKALRNYGFTPFVAGPAPLLEAMASELAEFKTIALTVGKLPLHWMHLSAQLAAVLRRERINLVHSHSVIATICTIPASCISRGPAVIETCHGREFWREGKRLKGTFWLDRLANRFVGRYIAVSHAAARFLRESKKIPQNKIVVIHNGRDLTSLLPPKPSDSLRARLELGLGNEQTVLLLGRLSKEKGHALLLDALKILHSRRPSVTAMFAGIGPLEAELKAICNAARLTDKVRFLGYRTDLPRVLAATDLVVLPSISEGLPLAAIEALATARPIVATTAGGIPEVVINGETGVLIPPQNPAALAEAIDCVLRDPALALRFGTKGRLFVEQHFDVRVQVERTMELYRSLTSSVGGRSPTAWG